MTPPPRDLNIPEEIPAGSRQGTGSFMIREYTPIEAIGLPGSPGEKKTQIPSTGFLITVSVILGVVLGGAALLGGIGNAFYVTRVEYTAENTINAKDKQRFQDENYSVKQALGRFEDALSRQDATLLKIADSVQGIKIDMARRGR
jgi:hypothetical protein